MREVCCHIPEKIDIPDNIANWLNRRDGAALHVIVNPASGDSGYAHALFITVKIAMITRTCHNCGYDVIWNPDDSESKCRRHSYNNWRYDDVFMWNDDGSVSLEDAFDLWLEEQPKEYEWNKPVVKKVYGRIGWR